LIVSPFNLTWGSSVFAIVSATNNYGTSSFSSEGNGAVILTLPDAPINLKELTTNKSPTTIGLEWKDGINNGGSILLDYTLFWDQGDAANAFVVLKINETSKTYLAINLEPGKTYRFKVSSRNIYGLSLPSNTVTILSAFKPA